MPVPPPVLAILADSDEPRSIRRLTERSNGNYRAYVKAAHDLADAGAVRLEPNGRELLVAATSSHLTGLANDLLGPNAHRGLTDVFRSDRPTMLWVLHKTHQVHVTADVMGKTPGAVRYMIRILQRTGLVIKQAPGYAIHPHHRSLIELLGELDRLRAEARLSRLAPRARLVWHLGPEFLIQTDEEAPEGAQLAGLDAFSQYGIPIQTKGPPLYYLGNRKLTAADALLQALVAADYKQPLAWSTDSPVATGPEFNYACLLWEKEHPKDIWDKSDLYFGREHPARDVVEYVHEKGDWAGFLPWSEHERLRKLYGVGQ